MSKWQPLAIMIVVFLAGGAALWWEVRQGEPREPVAEATPAPVATPAAPVPAPPEPPPVPPKAKGELPVPEKCGLEDYTCFLAGRDCKIFWARGTPLLRGAPDEKPAWTLELNFPVADIRQSTSSKGSGGVVVTSVDGLTSARILASTGKVVKIESASAPQPDAASVTQCQTLVTESRELQTLAVKALAKDPALAMDHVKKLLEYAERLSKLGYPTDAFRVWSAAKKTQKAVEAALNPSSKKPPELPLEGELEF